MIYLPSEKQKLIPICSTEVLNIFPIQENNGKYYLYDSNGNKFSEEDFDMISYPILKNTIAEKRFSKYIINDNGKNIVKTEYSKLKATANELIPFNKSINWGYCDKSGTTIIPAKYYESFEFTEDIALVREGLYYAFINRNGEPAVNQKFDDAFQFSEGLAAVKLNSRYGFIDKTGKIVIEPQFDMTGYFTEGLAKVYINGKHGYINKSGEIAIPASFEECNCFSGGLAPYREYGKWGFIDKSGNIAIKAIYDEVGLFYNKYALVKLNSKYGYIDKSGNYLYELQFENAYDMFSDFSYIKQNGNWQIIKDDKSELLPIDNKHVIDRKPIFTETKSFVAEPPQIIIEQSTNLTENNIIDTQIDLTNNSLQIGGSGSNLISEDLLFRVNDDIQVEDELTQLYIIDAVQTLVDILNSNFINEDTLPINQYISELYPYEENGKWGYINEIDEIAIPATFDAVSLFSQELATVRQGNRWGFIDKNGKFVIRPIFLSANSFVDDFALVSIDDIKYFFINKNGNNPFDKKFDDASDFSNGFALVRYNFDTYFLDKRGNLLTKAEYQTNHPKTKTSSTRKVLGYLFLIGIVIYYLVSLFNDKTSYTNSDNDNYYNEIYSNKYKIINIHYRNMKLSNYINNYSRAGKITPSIAFYDYYYRNATYNYVINSLDLFTKDNDSINIYFILSSSLVENTDYPYFMLKNNTNLHSELKILDLEIKYNQKISLNTIYLPFSDSLPLPTVLICYKDKIIPINNAFSQKEWQITNVRNYLSTAIDKIVLKTTPKELEVLNINTAKAELMHNMDTLLKKSLYNPQTDSFPQIAKQKGKLYSSGLMEVSYKFNSFITPEFTDSLIGFDKQNRETVSAKTIFFIQDIKKSVIKTYKSDKEFYSIEIFFNEKSKITSLIDLSSDNMIINVKDRAEQYYLNAQFLFTDKYFLYFEDLKTAKAFKSYLDSFNSTN